MASDCIKEQEKCSEKTGAVCDSSGISVLAYNRNIAVDVKARYIPAVRYMLQHTWRNDWWSDVLDNQTDKKTIKGLSRCTLHREGSFCFKYTVIRQSGNAKERKVACIKML